MMKSDDQELNELMSHYTETSLSTGAVLCKEAEFGESLDPKKKDEEKPLSNVVQWSTDDNRRFIPTSNTVKVLPSGFYEIKSSPNIGIYFELVPMRTEGLLRFPQANSDKVVDEISKFWDREEIFKKFKIVHRRGILLYGPPGSGKSCTIKILIRDIVNRGGIAINFTHPQTFLEGIRLLRSIERQKPLVVLMEDIDEIIRRYNESSVLNLLDGVELLDKTVFLATTNYPEVLGPRIVNRPSRFDKRFKIGHPNEESRMIYFNHLFENHQELKDKYKISKWVEDTDQMSLAHLKELFVAVVILGDDYTEAIDTLSSMKEVVSSSQDVESSMGFARGNKKLCKSRNGYDSSFGG